MGYFLDLTTGWSRSDVVVGYTSRIIMTIWSKMGQLELEESSEVEEGFRRPKYTQIKAEHSMLI